MRWLRLGAIGTFLTGILTAIQGCTFEDSIRGILFLFALFLPGLLGGNSNVGLNEEGFVVIGQKTQTIQPLGGTVSIEDGAEVVIPPGIYEANFEITLRKLGTKGVLAGKLQENSSQVQVVSDFYNVEVDKVVRSSEDVTLRIPFSIDSSGDLRVLVIIGGKFAYLLDSIVDTSNEEVILSGFALTPSNAARAEFDQQYSTPDIGYGDRDWGASGFSMGKD